jgi:hypothetical protein
MPPSNNGQWPLAYPYQREPILEPTTSCVRPGHVQRNTRDGPGRIAALDRADVKGESSHRDTATRPARARRAEPIRRWRTEPARRRPGREAAREQGGERIRRRCGGEEGNRGGGKARYGNGADAGTGLTVTRGDEDGGGRGQTRSRARGWWCGEEGRSRWRGGLVWRTGLCVGLGSGVR